MNNKRNNKENKLVRGSIRAFKDARFYEPSKTNRIRIESNGISAIILPQCLSKDLQKILSLHKIKYITEERECVRLIKEIEGIPTDRIIECDKDHVRIEFSGTEFECQEKMKAITAWLDANGIPYEEEGVR